MSFYLLLSFCFISMFVFNFCLNNSIKKNCSFIILFNLDLSFSLFERFYIKSFYKFLNYSRLHAYEGERIILKSGFLVFNNEKKKVEVLVQLRPPIIILIILSYSFVCLIILGF